LIKVIGSLPCEGVSVEDDPWIPMKITWLPRPAGKPLYLRVSGSRGGEVEFKVDPLSGALVQFIVIDEPPAIEGLIGRSFDHSTENRVPVLDVGMWTTIDNGTKSDFSSRPISISIDMYCWRLSGRIGVVFDKVESQNIIRSDEISVLIGADMELVEICAPA
jgi:hypothetical protein